MSLVFFDIEATDLDHNRGTVTQIAAAAVNRDLEVVEEFEVKVRFKEHLASYAYKKLTKYDPAVWEREAVYGPEAVDLFNEFLARHASRSVKFTRDDGSTRVVPQAQCVAHNANFDGPYIQAWAKKKKRSIYMCRRVICTIQRAEFFFEENPELERPINFKLMDVCRYFGIHFTEEEAHDALADVRATVELYRCLLGMDRVGEKLSGLRASGLLTDDEVRDAERLILREVA